MLKEVVLDGKQCYQPGQWLNEKYSFGIVAPGHNNFNSKDFLNFIGHVTKNNQASGKVIILDTLKKFANLMDKKQASDFMRVGRAFVSRGGTLILLAHTNKRRDEEKKVIFGGTSDIVDDVDCAFTLDEVNTSETHKIVRFENIKSRGNVELEVSYSYAQNEHDYEKLINSVKKESNYRPKNESAKSDEVGEIINAISEGIKAGITSKTKLVKSVTEETGLSRRKVITVLDKYTGDCWLDGHKWRCELGEHGAKIFKLLDQDESDEDFDAFESECAS